MTPHIFKIFQGPICRIIFIYIHLSFLPQLPAANPKRLSSPQILHWKVGTSMGGWNTSFTNLGKSWTKCWFDLTFLQKISRKVSLEPNLEYRIQFDIFWFENYPISLSPWTVDHQAWVKTTWIHLDSAGNRSNPRSAQGRQPFQLHLVGQHHQPIITMWSVSSFHPRSLWSYLIPLNA